MLYKIFIVLFFFSSCTKDHNTCAFSDFLGKWQAINDSSCILATDTLIISDSGSNRIKITKKNAGGTSFTFKPILVSKCGFSDKSTFSYWGSSDFTISGILEDSILTITNVGIVSNSPIDYTEKYIKY